MYYVWMESGCVQSTPHTVTSAAGALRLRTVTIFFDSLYTVACIVTLRLQSHLIPTTGVAATAEVHRANSARSLDSNLCNLLKNLLRLQNGADDMRGTGPADEMRRPTCQSYGSVLYTRCSYLSFNYLCNAFYLYISRNI